MLYESRSYTLHPGKLPEYLSLFTADNAVVDLLRPHLRGFWFTEGGRLNRVHHLWQYESRAARAEARGALARRPEMGAFFGKVTPLLQAQESWMLQGTVAVPVQGSTGGVFDRLSLDVSADGSEATGRALDAFASVLGEQFELVADLRGHAFETAGPLRNALFVLRSASLDQRDACWQRATPALQDVAVAHLPHTRLETELVLPVPFSPWR